MSLLTWVNTPVVLKQLTLPQLVELAEEIREFLINKVSAIGGHLGPNLGVVELTIGVHRVFDSPQDAIIFDTGHQSYVHKILTGRATRFSTLRRKDGLSGYPNRQESEHDWVESSHASASLSYVFGLAKANQLKGKHHHVVAIIGDGALTGGMAWEALNNIAGTKLPIVIIVNDNARSYAPTIGGIAQRLSYLRLHPEYEKAISSTKVLIKRLPFGKLAYKFLHGFKSGMRDVVIPQQLFSDLDIKYIGPVNGHDIVALENALVRAKKFSKPVILHVVTQKGKGYFPAETNEVDKMHSTGVIDPVTGKSVQTKVSDWTSVFAAALIEEGRKNNKIVAITAAMAAPTGLASFAENFPDRMFDVGIAEQHAVTMAAGLALGGMRPVVAIYSTFFNRGFDQFLMDVALIRQPVTLILDRAGITGADGPSHNGLWDLSVLSVIPNIKVAAPRDKTRLQQLLTQALADNSFPNVIRFPKGEIPPDIIALKSTELNIDVLYSSGENIFQANILIIAIGIFATSAIAVAKLLNSQGISVTVVDPKWIYPISADIFTLVKTHQTVVCMEDNIEHSGFGAMLVVEMGKHSIYKPNKIFALPKQFIAQGDREEILNLYGLTSAAMAHELSNWYKKITNES